MGLVIGHDREMQTADEVLRRKMRGHKRVESEDGHVLTLKGNGYKFKPLQLWAF